ncbi:MAG: hypothetical protein IID61_04990 [SAR324 cluster bacterium]|nr:hypothetical protein [SAR324 cluster bacterium]
MTILVFIFDLSLFSIYRRNSAYFYPGIHGVLSHTARMGLWEDSFPHNISLICFGHTPSIHGRINEPGSINTVCPARMVAATGDNMIH